MHSFMHTSFNAYTIYVKPRKYIYILNFVYIYIYIWSDVASNTEPSYNHPTFSGSNIKPDPGPPK